MLRDLAQDVVKALGFTANVAISLGQMCSTTSADLLPVGRFIIVSAVAICMFWYLCVIYLCTAIRNFFAQNIPSVGIFTLYTLVPEHVDFYEFCVSFVYMFL